VTVDISRSGYTVEAAARALRPLQHPGREIDLQHAHPAAHHRHDAQQGVAPVRRAHAHRARGPRAAAALPVSRHPGVHPLRFLPRDAYYAGGEAVPLLDEKDNVNRALVDRICADQITPYRPASRAGAGQLITRNVIDFLVGCCARKSASRCTASCTTVTAVPSRPQGERGAGDQADRLAAAPRRRQNSRRRNGLRCDLVPPEPPSVQKDGDQMQRPAPTSTDPNQDSQRSGGRASPHPRRDEADARASSERMYPNCRSWSACRRHGRTRAAARTRTSPRASRGSRAPHTSKKPVASSSSRSAS